MPGKMRGAPDNNGSSRPCTLKEPYMDISEPWMKRLLPSTDLLKGVEWQDTYGRVFFLDDHGVFRPFSWERLSSGEMSDWRELEGLPYNIGEILQQFTSMSLDRIHHYANTGEYLRVLYDEKKLVDVLIHVGNKIFAAHRIALACHSIYFARAFIMTHHRDHKLSEVTLKGIDPAAFQIILRFIYSGILYVNDGNVQNLLMAAGKLQIPAVFFRCRDFLGTLPLETRPLREVNPSAVRLKYRYMIDNFGYTATLDVFYALPVDVVEIILGDDNLKVSSEMEVFWAVMNWISYEPGLRRRHMDRLMQKVRFPCMSCEEVIRCSQANDQVSYSPALKNKIMEATWLITLRKVNSYDAFQLPCPQPRNCLREMQYSSLDEKLINVSPVDADKGTRNHSMLRNIVSSDVKSPNCLRNMDSEDPLFGKADEEDIAFTPPLCSTLREPFDHDLSISSVHVSGHNINQPPQSPVKSAPEITFMRFGRDSEVPPPMHWSSSSGTLEYLQSNVSGLLSGTCLENQLRNTLPSRNTLSVRAVATERGTRCDNKTKASGRSERSPEITGELQIKRGDSSLQDASAGLTASFSSIRGGRSAISDMEKTYSRLIPGGSSDNRRSPMHSPSGGGASSNSLLNYDSIERASSRSCATAKYISSCCSGSQSQYPGPLPKEGATSRMTTEKFPCEACQLRQASKTDSVSRGSSTTNPSNEVLSSSLPPPRFPGEILFSAPHPPSPPPSVIHLKEVPQPYLKFYISQFNDEQGKGQVTEFSCHVSNLSAPSPCPLEAGDILAIGGFMDADDTESSSQTSLFNGDNRSWKRFSNMPETRINFAVAFLYGVLYVIGGYDPHDTDCRCRAVRDVFKFDLKTRRWDKAGDLNHPRAFLATCVLNGKLYAMGGQDDRENALETAEVYDPATDTWSFITPMTCGRVSACAVGYEGKVMVVGGYGRPYDDSTPCPVLASTECYDPETNLWEITDPLRVPRAQACMVQMNGKLVLCGGAAHDPSTGKLNSISSVDIYDPASGDWSHVTDLSCARHNAGATVIGRKIYVVGGISAHSNKVLRSVECFDTETNTWNTSVPDLPLGAKSLSCIVVPGMMDCAC